MRQAISKEEQAVLGRLTYLAGGPDTIAGMDALPARPPFDGEVLDFLDGVSKALLASGRDYPDVVTFAFWVRRASTRSLKARFSREDGNLRFGRGTAFHIAPSNVAVNFAYSLAAGLLTGNANIVRLPTKRFPQAELICKGISSTLEHYPGLRPYICLVRYDRDREINDLLSRLADTRIVWGGDATIAELRRSPLTPRAGEITFADRRSLAVIDSEWYLDKADPCRIAQDFYNDTFLTDQNACTSPRIVVWLGTRRAEAKERFWGTLHELVKAQYEFQPVQGIDKLVKGCLLAAEQEGICVQPGTDNLIFRAAVPSLKRELLDQTGNSGYFLEYDCENILKLRDLCNDPRCQTVSYLGEKEMLMPLLQTGIKGIDRVVPVGKTMDFDLLWDGYDLCERLTRAIRLVG